MLQSCGKKISHASSYIKQHLYKQNSYIYINKLEAMLVLDQGKAQIQQQQQQQQQQKQQQQQHAHTNLN